MSIEIEVPELTDLKFPNGEVLLQADTNSLLGQHTKEELDKYAASYIYSKVSHRIEELHTNTLSKFTGKTSSEERDTWPEQQSWAEWYLTLPSTDSKSITAKQLLSRMVTDMEVAAMGGSPTDDDKASFMVNKILVNVQFYRSLISEASRAKRDAFALLNSISENIPAMEQFLLSLENSTKSREQEFLNKVLT